MGDSSDPLTHVAPALRFLLRDKGKVQAEVAEAMGAGRRSQVSRYFSGKVVPNLPNLLRVLDAMDADLNEFQVAIERSKGTMENDVAINLDDLLGTVEDLAKNNPTLLRIFIHIVYSLEIRIDCSQARVPSADHLAVLYETSPLAARLVTRYSEQWSKARRQIAHDEGKTEDAADV